MIDTIVIHTGELILKGANRPMFERILLDDIRARLAPIGSFSVRKRQGSVFIAHDGPVPAPVEAACAAELSRTFGIAHALFGVRRERTEDAIVSASIALMRGAGGTFKVAARRSDKRFPLDSQEIARRVGAAVLRAEPGLSVDVKRPDVMLRIEVSPTEAFVSRTRVPGAGGLPCGSSGTVAVMLSGGIDSPVAAWKAMRRGCEAVFVHFHSAPYAGTGSIDKARRLAQVLAGYQRRAVLYAVPLGDAQRAIVAAADQSLRVVLYRRMMVRIAEAIGRKHGALATVTGDSIGQVASQTLENLRTVTAAATLPVFRPLIGDDKNAIIDEAKRIGTYDISIEPHEDCCSVFMPDRPATRSTPERAEAEEAKLDASALAAAAVDAAERFEVTAAAERATITASA
jgi:thiamine biosynthesis protein ThiI